MPGRRGGTGHYDRLSDEELVRLCNEGGRESATAAFAALYARHKDFVVRVALRFVPDADAALDVLQETFGYLLKRFPPPGPGLTLSAKLTTLLYTVAKNTAIDVRRRTDRFRGADAVEPDSLPADDDRSAAGAGLDLHPLLATLSEERREVLLLRFVDDLSLQEIAAALGIPLGTVKSRLHLAVKALRESPEAKKFFAP
ncbi:MAG TPA: sigma-70 family RNA polymerase sigma factor [Woeseiaceae bacterium]|nr:sigma-70 family RNA polymerase sigma factor [Woeseiaceae bacterium]